MITAVTSDQYCETGLRFSIKCVVASIYVVWLICEYDDFSLLPSDYRYE